MAAKHKDFLMINYVLTFYSIHLRTVQRALCVHQLFDILLQHCFTIIEVLK